MSFKLTFVVFWLSIVIIWAEKSLDREYDILALGLSWSPVVACETFFINLNGTEINCSPCNKVKAVNNWTIHGLWPSKRHGPAPSRCSNIPYNSSLLLAELKNQMMHKWPLLNFNHHDGENHFWSHEWTKHGTCASDHESTNTLPKFFSKAIELFDRINVKIILDQAGIIAKQKYKSENIHRALINTLGVKAYLVCRQHKESRQQFLREIQICFNKTFGLVDCEDQNLYVESCSNDYEITYLESC